MSVPNTSQDRLGLALAGGGFRAALFHLGVLHRLAELDLLRRVQVLSTVSGGSIVGALYVLRLKKWLGDYRRLTREQYIDLVDEVDRLLCAGIDRNLRSRLLLNPWTTLRVLLTHHSLGRAMARLYERHIFADAAADLEDLHAVARRRTRSDGAVQLADLYIRPRHADLSAGVEAYNAQEVAEGGSVITRLVLNATTLNSGGRFLFSNIEVGDYYLGHFRYDEWSKLRDRRRLVRDLTESELQAIASGSADAHLTDVDDVRSVADLALWWRRRSADPTPPRPGAWQSLYEQLGEGFPGRLPDTSLGELRLAKISAWYLRYGDRRGITGGWTREEHWLRVCGALGGIDSGLTDRVRSVFAPDGSDADRFLEYLIEIYLLRTAERVSGDFDHDWNSLTVGDAVGASACFPPVFPPFVLLGVYDDAFTSRLGLTDGGVYDNAGMIALLDEGCTSIIASDTGAAFAEKVAAPADHVRMMLRIPAILTRVVGGFQRMALRERRRVSRDVDAASRCLPQTTDCDATRNALLQIHADRDLRNLTYFQMTAERPQPLKDPEPLELALDGRLVANIRTDLDAFGEVEIAALVNHGYDTADRYIRRYLTSYARPEWTKWEAKAPKAEVAGPRVERVIAAGSGRFLRGVSLRAPFTMAPILIVLVGLTALAVGWGTSAADLWGAVCTAIGAITAAVDGLVGWLPAPLARVVRFIPNAVPGFIWPWLRDRLSDGLALALVGGIAALLFAAAWIRGNAGPGHRRPRVRFARFRTIWKWTASYAGNVLWFAWALPLWIAAACTLFAAISWVVFFLPWRAQARIRPADVQARRTPSAPREKQLSEVT